MSQLLVQSLTGRTLVVNVDSEDDGSVLVSNLKCTLQDLEGVAPEDLRLLAGKRELVDEDRISKDEVRRKTAHPPYY